MDIEKIKKKIKERIIKNRDTKCWEWTGTLDKDGYGKIRLRAIRVSALMAHRISYQVYIGEIPDSLQIDHLCRNRKCVNPKHLEPVTCKENIRRGNTGIQGGKYNLLKTHCPSGHPYAGDNLYIIPNSGGRGCKACRRELSLRYYHSKKTAA